MARRRSSLGEDEKERAASLASTCVKNYERRSSFRDIAREESVRPVQVDEIQVGKLLGTGTFSNVYQASISIASSSSGDSASSDGICEEETKHEEDNCCYALKQLKLQVMDDADQYVTGAIDLALEAKLLSSMSHENIVKLHGVPAGSVSEAFSSGIEGNYFLVLDKMECSLKDRMTVWADEKNNTRTPGTLDSGRLRVALGIACGLQYLHSNNIVYRDLKPDNIGFDSSGSVKIFDFGLARELLPGDDRRPTGMAGTKRYMAPEVARYMHYGLSADTYSFGILLWELCALEKPFQSYLKTRKYSPKTWNKDVVHGNVRPTPKSSWQKGIKSLMEDCWSADASQRPEMERVASIIDAETSISAAGESAKGGKALLPMRKSFKVVPTPESSQNEGDTFHMILPKTSCNWYDGIIHNLTNM